MVVIRLRREGTTKRPTYRMVVADSRKPRDGRFIAILGNYNPRANPPSIVFKEEALLSWMGKGAQPSDTVVKLMKKQGLYKRWLDQKFPASLPKPVSEAAETKPKSKPKPKKATKEKKK
jgi:small subunit ribosomal protein S16